MKAVVLAAGEGKRLRPLTETRPKPMVPVANRPILEYVVEALADADVEELVFVVGYKRRRIQTYFGDGDDWNLDIEYAVQEKQLGTGHALLQAEENVRDEFLVVNGDSVIDSEVVRKLVGSEGTTVAVTGADEPSDYGVVELNGNRVIRITEKPEYAVERDIINAGVYRLDSRIFDEIRSTTEDGEMSLVSVLSKRADGGKVNAVRTHSWTDISHPWDVVDTNGRMLDGTRENARVHRTAHVADDAVLGEDARVEPNATVLPGTSLGDGSVVGAGAVLENSVVFDGGKIEEGAVVRDSVVAEGARIGPNVTVEGGKTDVAIEDELYTDVRLGGVIGDSSQVRGGAQLESGTVLGNRVRVGTGVTVDGWIPSETEVR